MRISVNLIKRYQEKYPNTVSIDKVIEFFEEELGVTPKLQDDYIFVEFNVLSLQDLLFDLGVNFGSTHERAFWTKPDEFSMANEYGEMFREALAEYEKESRITMDSIVLSEPGKSTVKVKVHPTQSVHFFNAVARYGEKLAISKMPADAVKVHEAAKKLLAALQQAAWFIENVTDETEDKNEQFFATREMWRSAYEAASEGGLL